MKQKPGPPKTLVAAPRKVGLLVTMEANLVSPELQRRGRLRTKYVGKTMRENLLEDLALAHHVSTHGLKERAGRVVV